MEFTTADLCDDHGDAVQVAEPLFRDFGGRRAFAGPIRTVKTFEDNSLVRAALEEPGERHVLVIDGGASARCALVGDRLAQLAVDNDWAGIVVHGCIRDSAEIAQIALGLKAVGTSPRKSVKRGAGQRDVTLHFGGVEFRPGHYVYADSDGVIVSATSLTP